LSHATLPPHPSTLSLHDALPISYKHRMGWQFPYVSSFNSDFNYDIGASITEEQQPDVAKQVLPMFANDEAIAKMAASCGIDLERSEEHTSELQSRENLVCRLLLE